MRFCLKIPSHTQYSAHNKVAPKSAGGGQDIEAITMQLPTGRGGQTRGNLLMVIVGMAIYEAFVILKSSEM